MRYHVHGKSAWHNIIANSMPVPTWIWLKYEMADYTLLYRDVIHFYHLLPGEMEKGVYLDCLIFMDISLKKVDGV